MEDEKQQLLAKLSKIKSKVLSFPKADLWLQKAKNLRIETKIQLDIQERICEQKNTMADLERKLVQANQALKETRAAFITGGPEAYFAKMEQDKKTNKYLATENLPSVIQSLKKIGDCRVESATTRFD
jgi:intraflagellar transport protein 81